MSDMQNERPGAPGTEEGEAGASESEPVAPSVDNRDEPDTGGDEAG